MGLRWEGCVDCRAVWFSDAGCGMGQVMMRGPGANGEAEVAVSEAVTVDTGEASGEARGLPKRGLVREEPAG
jgi:hypothetical protein